jgi:predicted methyltransferase
MNLLRPNSRFGGSSGLQWVFLACLVSATHVLAQDRTTQEHRREQWQNVDAIFAEMGVRPGASVADIGAGDGFFTSRLARSVGPDGRVFAVDIDDAAIAQLRKRLQEDGVENVTIVKGALDDPKLPDAALDAALIVNAYHEMEQHQLMLAALRRALKPDGRLVIVEPVTASKRGRPRADEARNHEIDPEYVVQDVRSAGFAVISLKDPFTRRDGDIEWLMTLRPGDIPPVPPTGTAPAPEMSEAELNDPSLRIPIAEFVALSSKGTVTVVDVRDEDSFVAGHIAGAIWIPLSSVDRSVEQLRALAKPVVTYCS